MGDNRNNGGQKHSTRESIKSKLSIRSRKSSQDRSSPLPLGQESQKSQPNGTSNDIAEEQQEDSKAPNGVSDGAAVGVPGFASGSDANGFPDGNSAGAVAGLSDGVSDGKSNGALDGLPGGLPDGVTQSGDDSQKQPHRVVNGDQPQQLHTEKEYQPRRESDDEGSYDLRPPPPTVRHENVEAFATRLFSADHLDLILHDQTHAARFRRFLDKYKPQYASTLKYYAQSKKAIAAVKYANAVASQMQQSSTERQVTAASLDDAFEEMTSHIAADLVEEALPAYLTNRLVTLVTESLVKDIIGNNAPFMKELIPNLAEVYCMTDPSLPDNPIVYASQEFYNTTQYGREYTIGRNCRFLQGPKTSNASVRRMVAAIEAGEETCETILNYSRDGTPFLNLLMIAPLYDGKGEVRYFLGCQIDVTPLVRHGKGLDSFSRLLTQDQEQSQSDSTTPQDPTSLLGELGQLLDEKEANSVKSKLRSSNTDSERWKAPEAKRPSGRRYLSMDDSPATSDVPAALWPDLSMGHSGRLPGVYRNYILVRPYPSLRITFTSPALRIPGLMQTKFLDRIGGSEQVREGLLNALTSGTSVTAKISWHTHPDGPDADADGKPRWIHCTPMFGSDEKVGVWMIVIVEEEEVTGILNRSESTKSTRPSTPLGMDSGSRKTEGGNLYANYRRDERNDRPGTNESKETTSTGKEQREVDGQFRDF